MVALEPSVVAVSFDFGQTLAGLDAVMLALRVSERGVSLVPERVDGALDGAWRAYDTAIRAGVSGHPWKLFMRTLLEASGLEPGALDEVVDWLWTEQPAKNLWRRPVPGMIELARDLGRAGVPVAVLSNSEGRLAELCEELGWGRHFVAVADSGKLGFEKPDRAIFDWTVRELGADAAGVVHIGDSLEADVLGALRAGLRAIWFTERQDADASALPDGAALCRDADQVRSALERWGLPVRPTIPVPAMTGEPGRR